VVYLRLKFLEVIEYYKENSQLYIIFTLWMILGVVTGTFIYGIIPFFFFIMLRKGLFEELFISYIFILIVSDSLYDPFFFAKNVKNIVALILGMHFLFNIKDFYPLNKLYIIFLPFSLFSIISMCKSIGDPFFFTSFQKTVSYFLSFLIIPNYMEKLYREKGGDFLRRLIFFGVTFLLLGFLLRYIAPNIAYIDSGRYRGVLGNPNGLGIYAVLLFIITFLLNDFFPQLFSKKERIIIYSALVLSIYLTNSRNAILALLMFYLYRYAFTKSPFLGVIVFILSLLVGELLSANIIDIISDIGLEGFFRVQTLEHASGRYIAWNFAWKQIQENFFIGKGFAYNEFYMRQHYGELTKLGHQGGIHNSFLTFWMDQGLIGLLIFIRSYLLVFIKAAKKTRLAFPIFFVITFTAMFESWLVGSLSIFAILGAIIFTLINSESIRAKIEIISEEKVLAIN